MIIEQARARPGELTLVTLGPLSNVAVALEREPQLPTLLKGLVMMVGAYRSPGNTAPTMEWNAGVDPEALRRHHRGLGPHGSAPSARLRAGRHGAGQDDPGAPRAAGSGGRRSR